MSLSEDTMRRLAFIRYLYQKAVNESRQPEPMMYSSILGFHDAVELFLQLASEKYGVGSKKTEFMGYFDLLKDHVPPDGLAQRESMKRLNSTRVELKHNGTWPSSSSVEGFRASVSNFFQDNTELVFQISFDSISMVNLVAFVEAREYLKIATHHIENNAVDEALCNLIVAFEEMLKKYESNKKARWGRDPFFFGEEIYDNSTELMRDEREDEDLSKFVENVSKSIDAMQEAIKIISLGLDYRKYIKFKLLVPSHTRTRGGKDSFAFYPGAPYSSIEECQFCLDFLIESALTLQEFDFEIENPYRREMGKEE